MKAENMFIGQRVQVKTNVNKQHGFLSIYLGRVGVIAQIDLGKGLDVLVEFDDGSTDWGNHSCIRKAKEA